MNIDQQRHRSDLRRALELVEKSANVAQEARTTATAALARSAYLESRLTSARELLSEADGPEEWCADRDAFLGREL